MKSIIKTAAVIAMMMVPALSHAQNLDKDEEPLNEFSISYGACPASDLVDGFANGLASAFVLGTTITDGDCYGVINIDYTRHVAKWLGIGVNASFSQSVTNNYVGVKQSDGSRVKGEKYGKDVCNNYTIMPTLKFNWFRRSHVAMYSRISAGVTLNQEKQTYYDGRDANKTETNIHFNGQLSPFGIEAGGEHVRAFSELGFGQAGIIQGGIRFRF